jgi:hypothetical protein
MRLSETAYICGIEGLPWEGRVTWIDQQLVIWRSVHESGKLSIPIAMDDGSLLTLSTCSLREQPEPYCLPLELARGSCYRLREQASMWQRSGLRLPDGLEAEIEQATGVFLDAMLFRQSDPDQCHQRSMRAVMQLESCAQRLVDSYADQAISFRKQQDKPLGTILAAALPPVDCTSTAEAYRTAFNMAGIGLSWSSVETDAGQYLYEPIDQQIAWAAGAGLRVCAGPLVEFDAKRLPHWLYLLEDDFDGLLSAVNQFVERTVLRYRGRVHIWNAAAGLNTVGPIRLNEEQVMRLSVTVIQAIRRNDPRTPVIISVDQPWGEYLARPGTGLSPLHFADALVRTNLGLAGLGIDMHLGYWPGGTLPRPLLEISQQIDRWSTLGLPLLVRLALPASTLPDDLASSIAAPIPSDSGAIPNPEWPIWGDDWSACSSPSPESTASSGPVGPTPLPIPSPTAACSIAKTTLAPSSLNSPNSATNCFSRPLLRITQ